MRHKLPSNPPGDPADEMINQHEAIQIMRVRNVKSRYSVAFEAAQLAPCEVTGHAIYYWRSAVVAARKRLDEIEARALADRQGTLGLQQARAKLAGVLAAAASKPADPTTPHPGLFNPATGLPCQKPAPKTIADPPTLVPGAIFTGGIQPQFSATEEDIAKANPPPKVSKYVLPTVPPRPEEASAQASTEEAKRQANDLAEARQMDIHRLLKQVFGMLGEAKRDMASSLKILSGQGNRTQPAPGNIIIEVHHFHHAAN